jgi:type II secretory pathway pseudopilin PulG
MLLVLAIVVAVTSLVLPALFGPMRDQQLRKAGDLVRAQWAKARLAAMKSGRIHLFRYEVGANTFMFEPWQGDQDDTSSSAGTASGALPTSTAAGAGNVPLSDDWQLPSGVTFYRGDTASDARSAQVEGGDATATSQPAVSGTSRPIVFYPDGTATDARVVLTNERFFVELQLRGLTGTSIASDLLSQEELSP